jgi:dipeptidyl aminopeptidase/acylaminoacyl peptidase
MEASSPTVKGEFEALGGVSMTERRPLEPNDLYRLRLLSDPQIAPDGSRVAFVLKQMDEEKNDYVSNIYVVDRDGTVAQFTSGDKDSAPRWSPDGRWLAFLSGRKEGAQLYLLSTRGGESVAITDRKLGAGVPFWSSDSSSIAFTGAVSTDPDEEKEDKEKEQDDKKPAKTKIVERASYKLDGAGYIGNRRRHIFTIDVAERKLEQLTHGDYLNDSPAWSPDSRHLAFASSRNPRWDVSTEGEIYVMPRTGGEARQITSGGVFRSPAFSPDGSRIAFAGYTDPDDVFAPPRLFSTTRDGSDLRDELGAWDGGLGNDVSSDVVHSDDGFSLRWLENGLHFIGVERGVANVYCAQQGVQPVTTGRHTVTDYSVAEDGTIAYAQADATHLPDIYLFTDGKPEQLTHENDAFLAEVEIRKPECLTYTGAKGEESDGWLLAPRGHESGKHPMLAYIHGGPQTAHGEAFFFEYQFLAGQGLGVFFPNIHGSSTYGREYQNSIQGDWGNLDYQDVLAGTTEAATREWVDDRRLGIVGGSYGGYMTNWVMSHSDMFKAGVTERCLCNMVSFMGTSDFGWLWNRAWGFHPEEDINKLWDMSPIKYVANVNGPLMVIHSERDDRTPLEQGEQMFVALRRLDKVTKLIMFPEESHGLSREGKPSRRVERMGYIRDWFRQYL